MHAQHLIAIEKSQTLLLNEQSRLLESAGQSIYKFGFGQTPFPPPLRVVSSLKNHAREHAYSSVQGLPELREAVANFHSTAALPLDASQVFIAPGSKTLLYCLMACFEAIEVLIPAPAWVSYAPQATMLGHSITRIPASFSERWRITPQALRAAIKKRKRPEVPLLMIFNAPGNPDGLSYDAEELQALAAVMNEHNILVISDEIYGMLDHAGEHESLAEYYSDGTITTTGLSKWCGAGGWRLGVAILPKNLLTDFADTLLGVASEVYSCAPTPIQHAAITAYSGAPDIRDYVNHQRRILHTLGSLVHSTLIGAGINVCAPRGGFYLFVDFMNQQDTLAQMGIRTSEDLCKQLLQDTGVVLLPSHAFGMPESHLSARLAYVDFDGEAALLASETLGLDMPLPDDFCERYCSRTLTGAQLLAQWAEGLKSKQRA